MSAFSLYVLPLDDVWETPIEPLFPLLGENTRHRVCAQRNAENRRRSFFAYALAQWLLLYKAGLEARACPICFTGKGKPYVPQPGIHISLSHSGRLVACSLADAPCGVDVELPHPVSPRLAARVLPDGDLSAFLSLPDKVQQETFLRRWTLLESHMKQSGEGLAALPLLRQQVLPGWNYRLTDGAMVGACCAACTAVPEAILLAPQAAPDASSLTFHAAGRIAPIEKSPRPTPC